MSKLRYLVMLAVVVACGMSTLFPVDRNYRPIARIDPSQESTAYDGSPQEPIVPAVPLDDVRKAEQRATCREFGQAAADEKEHSAEEEHGEQVEHAESSRVPRGRR